MVSAVHHEGRRLYELAREGVTVERAARTIRIDGMHLLDFTPGGIATATLDVACGKGTYIRTLCADLGAALGWGGTWRPCGGRASARLVSRRRRRWRN